VARRWDLWLAITAAIGVAACGGTPSGASSGAAAASRQTETTSPSLATAAAPTPTLAAVPTSTSTPRPAGLFVGGSAEITVAELNVRQAPSIKAAMLEEGQGDGPPALVRWGTASGFGRVFILAGPVDADGYRWWQVHPTVYELNGVSRPAPLAPYPLEIGWVADGDSDSAWLVPADECPETPIELADITFSKASWGVRLGCFQGDVLTLRGWLTTRPPEDAGSPAPPVAGLAIFAVKMGWYDEGNLNRLEFRLHPEMSIQLPSPEQWVEVTGSFDDPTASLCGSYWLLQCRASLTVTSIRALGP
jgi:hypothetical protein